MNGYETVTGTAFKCLPTKEDIGYIVSDLSVRINRRFTRLFSAGCAYVRMMRKKAPQIEHSDHTFNSRWKEVLK